MGNIPPGMLEHEALEHLGGYGVRPWKLVIRFRGSGLEGGGVAYYDTAEMAQSALDADMHWPNGRYILCRSIGRNTCHG